jgi:hypothetical protein
MVSCVRMHTTACFFYDVSVRQRRNTREGARDERGIDRQRITQGMDADAGLGFWQ